MVWPRVLWDSGTAYDFFISLDVLHRPTDFGVRGVWAAGVRARLPTAERETLERAQQLSVKAPLHWIHNLPAPKDGATVLWSLRQIPPARRLPLLTLTPDIEPSVAELFRGVAAKGSWDGSDEQALFDVSQKGKKLSRERVTDLLEGWAQAEEFGERYADALNAYFDAFFAEEEKRILPVLQGALVHAQRLAQQMDLPDLLEELAQGLRLAELPEVAEFVIVPSYWTTTLVYFGYVTRERYIWVYGARPLDVSLVPGQTVPDALLRRLKALSDPTRLRILGYLGKEPLAPSELARRLRLRIPTVMHHLDTLRLAGLVQLTLREGKERSLYAMRPQAIMATFGSLKGFLEIEDHPE